MAIFKPIQENEATGKVKEIYEDIKKKDKLMKFQIFGKT